MTSERREPEDLDALLAEMGGRDIPTLIAQVRALVAQRDAAQVEVERLRGVIAAHDAADRVMSEGPVAAGLHIRLRWAQKEIERLRGHRDEIEDLRDYFAEIQRLAGEALGEGKR